MTLTASSKSDYLGNIIGTWKNFNPLTVKLDFGAGNQAIDLRESYSYLIMTGQWILFTNVSVKDIWIDCLSLTDVTNAFQ